MKILVIDNGHLRFKSSDTIECIQLKRSSATKQGTDAWIMEKLDDILKECYSLIILPYSLSDINYAEYSGIRIAAFIRLLKENRNSLSPIVFNGPDTIRTIASLSDLSTLLLTPGVSTCSYLLNNANIEEYIKNEFGEQGPLPISERQYMTFMSTFVVSPPANYDNRHSIANKWAIKRWSDMLNLPYEINSMEEQLFFRYIRVKLGETQSFNKKWRANHPNVGKIDFSGSSTKRRAFIDDEYSKGWESILRHIIEDQSGQELIVFKGFEQGQSKQELENKIKLFIDETPADCYLLDLRLHEDDANLPFEELSGHAISAYIKQKNRGNRIIIFTASNKVWNLKKELLPTFPYNYSFADAYIVKESPEQLCNREQSYLGLCDFIKSLKNACEQSYIKDYIQTINYYKVNGLDDFINILLIDKDTTKKQMLPTLLLSLIVYLEKRIGDNFKFVTTDLYHGDNKIDNVSDLIQIHKENLEDGHTRIKNVKFTEQKELYKAPFNSYADLKDKRGADIIQTLVIAALHYFYKLPDESIVVYLEAKFWRNTSVAHNGGNLNVTIEDIKKFFEKVIQQTFTITI